MPVKAQLETASGALVQRFLLASRECKNAPEIIVWGERTFALHAIEKRPNGWAIYRPRAAAPDTHVINDGRRRVADAGDPMSDSDRILTAVAASIQNVIARLLPAGFACVIVVGRSGTTKLRVAKNCDDETMISMLESAKGAGPENEIDLKRLAQ